MNRLTHQLEEIVQKASWPAEHRTTMKSRRIYEHGLDMVNFYRGDPHIFVEALQAFQGTRSYPYAYAGVAYTLAMASHDYGGKNPDHHGLEKAMVWLEKSQNLEPDRAEINFIEAAIYFNGRQFQNARLILDYLNGQNINDYYLCATEMRYWQEQGAAEKYMHWCQLAMKQANTKMRQIFVLTSLADFYFKKGVFDRAISTYLEVAKLDPNDPWLWHTLSIIYLTLEEFKQAEKCNKHALSLMDFAAARKVEKDLKEKRGGIGRLFKR